jgi:hypothetical protein
MLLDKNLALGVMTGFYTFSQGSSASYGGTTATASASINFLEGLASVRYRFDGTSLKPFLVGGAGVALMMQSVSASSGTTSVSASASQMNPMIAIGGGVEIPGGSNMSFFGQAKYSMVFVPGVTQTIGGTTVTTGGGTSSYIPVEVGINFSL